ncbi:MAG: hypothetical protein ABI867_07955 [Kofleriaceae bacterium]
MSVYNMNCPPLDCGPCGTLPSGFVRLRYFYGKRLGVADLVDEQRYHSGKMRFHEQRLHGAGVLCGLRVEPLSTLPADATIVRVMRGAAIDSCGREIIVGYDQCIDIDAWLAKWIATHPIPDATTTLDLCVVLRYRECATSPEPAPRDPCSCDTGGCELGRVREEFELDLVLHDEMPPNPAPFPAAAALQAAIAAAVGGTALGEAIAAAATAGCPIPDGEGWLPIACFTATLSPLPITDRRHVTAIADFEAVASILYQTALLQDLLRRQLAATVEAGSLLDGPEIAALALDAAAPTTTLALALSGPLTATTVGTEAFRLYSFDPAQNPAWKSVDVDTAYDNTVTPPRLVVKLATDQLFDGGRYRLVSAVPADQPIVDDSMKPLRPLRFSHHFQIKTDAGSLVIAPIAP